MADFDNVLIGITPSATGAQTALVDSTTTLVPSATGAQTVLVAYLSAGSVGAGRPTLAGQSPVSATAGNARVACRIAAGGEG